MSGDIIAMLAGVTAALFLAVHGLRSQSLSFGTKAAMAIAWLLIIAALAFVLNRLGV